MKSESKERAKGTAQQVGGTVEKLAGKLTGNERMEERGKAKEVVGEGRKEAAKAAGRTRGTAQQVAGKAKQVVGKVLGDERLEAEGDLQDLEGEARRKANK